MLPRGCSHFKSPEVQTGEELSSIIGSSLQARPRLVVQVHLERELVRESTKRTNKRVAEQIEAAHKTSLAKGEVGIRDRSRHQHCGNWLTAISPHCRLTFSAKKNTPSYYENGTARLLEYRRLADEPLDSITSEMLSAYARHRLDAGLEVARVNRELQLLRRIFALAIEWGKVEKAPPRVRMISGEAHREMVLSETDEGTYLEATLAIGNPAPQASDQTRRSLSAPQYRDSAP
jgi:hypothetical protein